MLPAIILALISYLLGSIPFGLLLTKLAGLGDIRQIGSGNIGATNVLRTGNKKLAALTLLLDGLKGSFAVLLTLVVKPEDATVAGLFALLGHLFPVWLKFKGGKGVATAVGVLTALAWPVGVATMITWTLTAKISRLSSLAALVALGLTPIFMLLDGHVHYLWLTLAIIALVFAKHHANIRRLIDGTEPKIGEGAHATPDA